MDKIRLFESFAGVGTQRMALERLGIPYESVGISEIDEYAILSYAAIHDNLHNANFKDNLTDDEKREYLKKINAPLDSKTFKNKADKLKGKRLDDIYKANVVSKNYGDISKIDAKDLPDMDLFTYSFPCFTEDALVLTQDGYKKIIDVNIDDKVLTHDNTYKRVVNKYDNGIHNVIRLTANVIDYIDTTDNHKFYVKKDGQKPEWIEVKNLNESHYLGFAINKENKLPKSYNKDLNRFMKKKEFYFLLGTYLSKGNLSLNEGLVIYIHESNIDEFKRKIEKLYDYNIKKVDDYYRILIIDEYLEKYVKEFGTGFNKKITGDIINLPKDRIEEFVRGIFLGQGDDISKYKKYNTNLEFIYGLGQCIAKAYNKPFNIKKKRTLKGKILYTLSIDNEEDFYEDGYIWAKLLSKQEKKSKNVYDLEVYRNHSFTVNNIIVHNCQDISIAGKEKGFKKGSGTRSGLLWECEKIIKEKRPKYLLMENVKALTFKKNIKGYKMWLDVLENYGYTNYWDILNSKDYEVPQNRERVFCVSILNPERDYEFPEKIKLDKRIKDILEDNIDEKFFISKEKSDELLEQLKDRDYVIEDTDKINQIAQYPTPTRKNSSRYRVYDKEYISPTIMTNQGGGLQPHVVEKVIGSTQKNAAITDGQYSPTLTSAMGEGGGHVPMLVLNEGAKVINPLKDKTDYGWNFEQNVYTEESVTRTLKAGGGSGNIPKVIQTPVIAASRGRDKDNPSLRGGNPKNIRQRLEPNEDYVSNTLTTCLKDNYLIDNYKLEAKEEFGRMGQQAIDVVNNNENIKNYDIISPYNKTISNNEGISPTITTRPEGLKTAILPYVDFRIRKLTPLECWRLMGIDDDNFYKAKEYNSNSQLYKQAGNAIVVNVLYHIFNNLFNEEV